MEPWMLSILLLLIGVALIFLELFIPSGGVIGVLAGVAIIASVIIAFAGGSWRFGIVMLAVSAIIVPSMIGAAIRIWPMTPMGRRVLIGRPTSEEVLPDGEEYQTLKALHGRRGKAKTDMLPSGKVTIDGKEFDAVSVGIPIDKGQIVRVVEVENNHIVVRPASDDEAIEPDQPEQDVLSRPVETLGIDPFEDPLA